MISKKIVLKFPKESSNKPIVYNVSKKYDLTFNIMYAKIFPRKEGSLVLEISGNDDDFQKGIEYIKSNRVDVQFIEENISRDEEKCYHCGFCVVACPTDAFTIDDRSTMKVELYKDRCIACGLCVKACPVKAIKLSDVSLFI